MIIYGVNPVLEAIRADPKKIHYVAISKEHGGKVQRVVAAAKEAGVPVRMLPSEQIDRLAQRGVHNGVVADVSEAGYADFDELVDRATVVLILDGVTDPQNFGAILRVADGFGIDGVVIPQHESAGLSPAAALRAATREPAGGTEAGFSCAASDGISRAGAVPPMPATPSFPIRCPS